MTPDLMLHALTAVTLFIAVATVIVVCAAAFVASVACWLVWEFAVKLKGWKPKAFLIEDIQRGVYKLVPNGDGSFDLIASNTDEEDDDDTEETTRWVDGMI